MSLLIGARIVLGVTGGIAAYKAADLASSLVQAGALVDVVLTAGAQDFVQPLTFNAITRRPVHTDLPAPWTEEAAGHVTLAAVADLLLVAPATANSIARLALGFADDLLGAVALATAAPMLIAPAMEHGMYHHPATQAHLATLLARGAVMVGPESGRLASGALGDGRLAPTAAVVGAARALLGRGGPLTGTHVVVTAGGTHEPIDPVRYVGNRSSGAMGFALAQAAIDHGATVTLIAGPTHLTAPFGAKTVGVETTSQMLAAVEAAVATADALIMAAAVADFRPAEANRTKIKKRPGNAGLDLALVRNPDILASVGRPGLLKIGFAAETENLVINAEAKLRAKGLAMIVANDAVATIGSSTVAAVILRPDRPPESLPEMPKSDLARVIVGRLASLLADAKRGGNGP